jgi:serralysin
MAIFTLSDGGIDLAGLSPEIFLEGVTKTATPTTHVIDWDGELLTLTGEGFVFDGQGKATAGTVHELVNIYEGESLKVTGLDIPAAQFVTWALNEDIAGMKAGLFAGNDQISGGLGGDTFFGGGGNDTPNGGGGDDVLTESAGANRLRGEDGADSMVGGADFDDIHGNMGADTATGGQGDDWVVGGKDNDLLFGDAGGDIVHGNLGNLRRWRWRRRRARGAGRRRCPRRRGRRLRLRGQGLRHHNGRRGRGHFQYLRRRRDRPCDGLQPGRRRPRRA